MGGGQYTKRGKGLVVLAAIPFPEASVKGTLAEIEEEFPDLEYHYVQHKWGSGDLDVPAGTSHNPAVAGVTKPLRHYVQDVGNQHCSDMYFRSSKAH